MYLVMCHKQAGDSVQQTEWAATADSYWPLVSHKMRISLQVHTFLKKNYLTTHKAKPKSKYKD